MDKEHKKDRQIQEWLNSYDLYRKRTIQAKDEINVLSINKNVIKSIELLALEDLRTTDFNNKAVLDKIEKLLECSNKKLIINQINEIKSNMIEAIKDKLDKSLNLCFIVNALNSDDGSKSLIFSAVCENANGEKEFLILDLEKISSKEPKTDSLLESKLQNCFKKYNNFDEKKILGMSFFKFILFLI